MYSNIIEKKEGVLSHFSDDFIAQRMMSMGVIPGSNIKLVRSMPNIGSYYIRANNRHIAMREEEVKSLIIL